MATRKRRTASPSPSPSPPRKLQSQSLSTPTTLSTTPTTLPTTSPTTAASSVASQPPADPLPADLDMNQCPFTLTSPNHNLLLTLLTQSSNTPHPWIKCHKCGKWRKLPPTLSALSPLLPSLPLTLQSLSALSAPFLPFPFTCAAVHWDLDRRICSAIQDYQDIVHEWHQVPLRLVRANPRFDFYVALAHFLRVKGVTIREYPCIYGKSVDLYALYNLVHWAGGDAEVSRRGWWPAVYERLRLGGKAGQAADVDYLIEIYRSYFFEWQESRPAVFDDGAGEVAGGVGDVVREGKENGVAGSSGSGQAGGSNGKVKEASDRLEGATDSERNEQVESGDTEMQEGEHKEPNEADGSSVEGRKIDTAASQAGQTGTGSAGQAESESGGKPEKSTQPS